MSRHSDTSATSAPEPKTNTTNFLLNCILIFILCSIIGWLWEVSLYLVRTGEFVNRGVLHGPWLPIYGWGGMLMAICLRPLRNHPILVFVSSVVVCGLLEYLTGWYLETFKHLKWWDYSGEFLSIDGRVCFISLLAFGVCGLGMIYGLYPAITKLFNRIPLRPKKILCFALVLFFMADFVYSSDVPNTGRGITSEISQVSVEQVNFPVYKRFYL